MPVNVFGEVKRPDLFGWRYSLWISLPVRGMARCRVAGQVRQIIFIPASEVGREGP